MSRQSTAPEPPLFMYSGLEKPAARDDTAPEAPPPDVAPTPSRRRRKPAPATTSPSPSSSPPDSAETLTYPFPLRPGIVVRISLPANLTIEESKRLGRFLDALAVDARTAVRAGANGHRSATGRRERGTV